MYLSSSPVTRFAINPMKTFLALLKASTQMFMRNKQALFFSFFMPMVIMGIFGLVGFDKPQQYDVGLVVSAPAPQTAAYIEQLKAFELFKIHEGTLEDEQAALKEGDRSVVVVMPSDFIDSARISPQALVVYVNESQPAQSQAILSILNQTLDKTSIQLAGGYQYFSVIQESVDARNLRYIDFLLPGLIGMSVMQMSVFSVAFVFVQYKEKGVLRRLAATPMRPMQFVAANTITRLVVSVLQAIIFIVMGILMMDAVVVGSYWLILLCILLGALMFLGLGFTISGIAKTVESIPALANLIVFPMLFLGGTFFPISGMPHWLQSIAKFLPLSFFSTSLRDVMTKDASFGAIKYDLLGMVVWGVILIVAATYTFGFQERENA
jgi:ABC-2 type transport system permease protein